MKVSDIVKARHGARGEPVSKGYGVILDHYEDDIGIVHFKVQWGDRKEWLSPFELELISETR